MRLKVHSMLKIIKPTIISVCFFSSLAYATESESTPKDDFRRRTPTFAVFQRKKSGSLRHFSSGAGNSNATR